MLVGSAQKNAVLEPRSIVVFFTRIMAAGSLSSAGVAPSIGGGLGAGSTGLSTIWMWWGGRVCGHYCSMQRFMCACVCL